MTFLNDLWKGLFTLKLIIIRTLFLSISASSHIRVPHGTRFHDHYFMSPLVHSPAGIGRRNGTHSPGMVDESLMAHLIKEKFLFHAPVYRLTKKYRQAGLGSIDKKNMRNWIHRAAEALMPLYHLLEKDLLQSPYLQGDESTLNVMSSNKPGASHNGYMWLIHNPEDRTTLFHYDLTRQHREAHELFGNYFGILQADGYEAYESVAKVNQKMELINCMAHARRKFMEDRIVRMTNFIWHKTYMIKEISFYC